MELGKQTMSHRMNTLVDSNNGGSSALHREELPPVVTNSPAADASGNRQVNRDDLQGSTEIPLLFRGSRGRVSSVDERIPRGRGCPPTDRRGEAVEVPRSRTPLPTRSGYFRYEFCCGLVFVPYSWLYRRGLSRDC
jgi:hypothetical protein